MHGSMKPTGCRFGAEERQSIAVKWQVGTEGASPIWRLVLVDDVGRDLQGHSSSRILSDALSERGASDVNILR
jgi:hypothetical protein